MVYILARIVDSERTFNGSADPMITADRGFIQIMGPDFGFWLFGSSDRGSQRRPGKLTFSILCTDVTQWRKLLEIVSHLCVTGPLWRTRI